jgi:septal ring factor EnvC (AmiA/AmiB activator)
MHPITMLINAARYRPLMQEARELECLDYAAVVQAYLSGEITLPPLKIMEALAADKTRLFPEARIRVSDAAAEIARLGTDHERLLRESEDSSRSLTKELELRGNEIARLTTEITGLHAGIAARNAEIAGLNAAVADLHAGMAARNAEIAGLNTAVADLHAGMAARNAEIAGLNSEIVKLNTCLATVQGRATRMGIALAARNCEILSNRQTTMWKMARRLQTLRGMVSAKTRNERDARLVAMSGLFDRDYYVSQNPRLEQLGLNPVYHYVEYGAAEGRDPHPLFDTSFYLASNPDVARSRMNPLAHYHANGGAEGRDPHPSFKAQAYLAQNPEVLQAGMTPLLHYLVFGSA